MFSSERDVSIDSELMRMLAVVIYAVRPLSMQELCVVIDAWDPEWAIERRVSSERQENLEQKLLSWSQGLLDVQSGLVVFVPRSAREHAKNFLLPKFNNAPPDGEIVILEACLLYLQHMQEEMERHCHDTESELSYAGNAFVENSPFLHYAVTFWVLHGICLQRKIEPYLFEKKIQRMHRSHFKTWKFYFISARESSEGDTARQEVESYFLARGWAVHTPIEGFLSRKVYSLYHFTNLNIKARNAGLDTSIKVPLQTIESHKDIIHYHTKFHRGVGGKDTRLLT